MSDQQGDAVVLSPHLDDAVLSAFAVLGSRVPPRVITAYAGVPKPGYVTDLDRTHGARESASWLRLRREQDRQALAMVGADAVHLDHLEVQFRAFELPHLREAIERDPTRFVDVVSAEPELRTKADALVPQLLSWIGSDNTVYGPVGIGGHPDHCNLGAATLLLSDRVRHVHFYADSPYFVLSGLPSWISGVPNSAADSLVERAVRGVVDDPARLERRVVELSDRAFELKLAAMDRYETEMPSVRSDLARAGVPVDTMRFEVYWTLDNGDA